MIDRRSLLKIVMAMPATLGLPVAALAGRREFDALILDRRFPGLDSLAATSADVHAIDGDITALWFDRLDPRWRKPGFVVAGYTGADALFVLERLAWDRGRRVVERRTIANSGIERPLTFWIIAPVHPSVTGSA